MLNSLNAFSRRAAVAATGSRGSCHRAPQLLVTNATKHRRWLSSAVTEPVKAEIPPTATITLESTGVDESNLKNYLRPSEIVKKLDDYVVGQQDAKRAVAIALRNRWRRRNLPEDIKKEIMPKNVLLVGPTGEKKLYG